MFANACSRATSKTCCSIGWQIVAFIYPSFWSEFFWIFVILLTIVYSHYFHWKSHSFLDRYSVQVMVFLYFSSKNLVDWSIVPSNFLLDAINIVKLLKILVAKIIIFHIFLDFCSDFFLDFWMLGEDVNHGIEILGCSIDASPKECDKLVKKIFICVSHFPLFPSL